MDNPFFGYGSQLLGGGAEPPLEEPDECGLQENEDSYDALNDETFGADYDGDWEEDHEALAELTEQEKGHGPRKSGTTEISQEKNDTLPTDMYDDLYQDLDFVESISQMVLESDQDDSDVDDLSHSKTNAKRNRSKSLSNSSFQSSTSSFQIMPHPLIDSKIWSNTQTHHQKDKISSVIPSLPLPLMPLRNAIPLSKVKTLEEVEQELLAEPAQIKVPPSTTKSLTRSQSLLPPTPIQAKTVEDIEKDFESLPIQDRKESGESVSSQQLPRTFATSLPPPLIPLQPPAGGYPQSHSGRHPQQLNFVQPPHNLQRPPPNWPMAPHHQAQGMPPMYRFPPQQKQNVGSHQPHPLQQTRHPVTHSNHGQVNMHHIAAEDARRRNDRHSQAGPRPERYNRHLANGHAYPLDDYDEYAGLMTSREKQWLINIQLMQISSDRPYVDDYYFTVLNSRRLKKSRMESGDDKNGPVDDIQLVVPERSHNDSTSRNYTPLQFENSLGRLQVSSVIAPRKILSVVIGNVDSDSVQQKETNKFKQGLLEIERLYSLLLEIDDFEKRILALPPDGEAKSNLEKLKDQMCALLVSSLTQEEKLNSIVYIRKGKTLITFCFPLMSDDELMIIWSYVFSNFSLISKKDQADQILNKFYPALKTMVQASEIGIAMQLARCTTGVILSKGKMQPGNHLTAILKNRFGISSAMLTIQRVGEINAARPINERLKSDWSAIVKHVISVASNIKEGLAKPLEQFSEWQHHLTCLGLPADELSIISSTVCGETSHHDAATITTPTAKLIETR